MKQVSRIGWSVLASVLLLDAHAVAATEAAMDLQQLTALVQDKAQQAYDATARAVPEFLNELGYDEYRDFEYKPERALWHGQALPFEVIFFHPGYLYEKSVAMHVIEPEGSVVPFHFSHELFEYGPQEDLIPLLPEAEGLEFSGFKVLQRLDDGSLKQMGVFQGASYFRMVSSTEEYGLSGRALAVNTNPGPEEFPDFTTFWFAQPAANDTTLVFYGLAESPSLVAGYRFVLTPGSPIQLHVEGRVVLRQEVKELGLTAYSSMFWYGENTPRRPADFRPEVHDSDGLYIETAEARLWRPLANPPRTRTDILPGDNVKAFGLLQRDRNYEHYQDIEADYHLRPDTWVIPGSGMRNGSLRLLEIESPHEYADNVALIWSPAQMPEQGNVFAYDYDIFFGEHPLPAAARVVATRYGESLRGDGSIEFVIDLAGGELDSLPEHTEVQIDSTIAGGEFVWRNIRKNPHNDTWRLNLRVLPAENTQEIRLSAALKLAGEPLSETWTYWWMPRP
jgi:glucans biosynthesis protein